MSLLFPRFAYAPVRCAPIRHEIAPLWSLFDDATRQLQQVERHARRAQFFNPRFDLKEDKEAYILEGEVPGFKDDELSIEWKDNVLAIRGHHESVTESGNKPAAVEAQPEKAAIEEPVSESSSIKSQKSHQATVEDEEPANASAVAAETATPETSEQATTGENTETAPTQPQEPQVQRWISERRTGQFLRQFSFPSNAVNHDAIKASLQSGILKVVVPKAPTPESRRINIE